MSIKPYYDHAGITIYHGDCRDIMPQLEPVDLVLTDPPYGTNHYASDKNVLTGGCLSVWCDLYRVVLFGYPENIVRLCVQANVIPVEWITWWPTNGGCRGMNFHGLRRESEAIAIFGQHQLHILTQLRGQNSQNQVKKNYPKGYNVGHGEIETRKLSDVWTDAAPGLAWQYKKRLHPNEKPLSLLQKLLLGFPDCNMAIDPFMGSGTTLKAAKNLGRKAIGIEIEEKYCEIAAKRMSQEVLSL